MMRLIELTAFETNEPIIINASRINFMYQFEDQTILKIDSAEFGVKETTHEILLKIRG